MTTEDDTTIRGVELFLDDGDANADWIKGATRRNDEAAYDAAQAIAKLSPEFKFRELLAKGQPCATDLHVDTPIGAVPPTVSPKRKKPKKKKGKKK